MQTQNKKMSTETLVMGALMTALVIVFQIMGTYTTLFGPFSTAIALVPIAIGAIKCGPKIGAWLGFIFAVVVLVCICPSMIVFYNADTFGTIVTVLVKGILCGYLSGLIYKLVEKWNTTVSTIIASIVCPVVNTSIFFLGCLVFYMDDIAELASGFKSTDTGIALFFALALGNFLFELGLTTVFSPIVVKILNISKKK